MGKDQEKQHHRSKKKRQKTTRIGRRGNLQRRALPKNQGREIRPREMGERERIMRTGLASSMHQCVVKVQHTGEMDTWPTFATRPIRKGSKTLMGVCLMPAPHGLIRSEQGRLCGHTPCMQCTKKKQEKIMCLCCATRLEVLGAGKGGAGPLQKPVVQRRSTPGKV